MTKPWIIDLRVAASFVRSIQTDDHEMNFELGLLADRIDVLIDEMRPRCVPLQRKKDGVEEIGNC